MYTLEKAAAVLGITKRTVRIWLKKCNIETRVIETDRRRAYILDSDMLELVGYADRKTEKKDKKTSMQKGGNAEVIEKENLYSLARAASFLGVSADTVRHWIGEHHVEKRILITDRKRLYISHEDVLMLADLYRCELAAKLRADGTTTQEEIDLQGGLGKKLYSLAEVALYLNVSQGSVNRWITLHSIEKKINTVGRRQVYIACEDVFMLADLHKRDIVRNMQQINIVEEIKEIRGKLKEFAAEIEDIKHDMRIYAKRSIYVG